MKIFISYTLKDGDVKEHLLKKIEALSSLKSLDLFIDKLHNHDLDPQLRIKKEIQSSDILILLSSPKIFESDWVKKEIVHAREKNLPIYLVSTKNILKTIKSVYKLYCALSPYGITTHY